ncbi:hypothetical protein V6N12_073823 [Hibiscus sabdariffa]|uniref:Reverse transcriptase zinc-binding domain-containing protein n=1 Tax=Hibiscus sabdariffa TaxID=183260 RepID=A0ABR2BD52_9ROSI
MTLDGRCGLCRQVQEDVLHALCRCSHAQSIWFVVIQPHWCDEFFSLPLTDWIITNLSNNGRYTVKVLTGIRPLLHYMELIDSTTGNAILDVTSMTLDSAPSSVWLVPDNGNMDASFGNDDNKPNGSSGIDASVGDELIGVHFGWSDDMVDEDSYEAHEDSGDSNWLGR